MFATVIAQAVGAFATMPGCWLPGIILLVTMLGCSEYRIQETRTMLALGEDTLAVVVHDTGVPGLTLINLHDNEDTSVQAGLAVLRQRGGRLIELQHSGERNVEFILDGTRYTFDPNRIFTDEGIAATLRDLGPYSDSAHAAVRAFAGRLLERFELDRQEVVITLHNNTGDRYNILSYTDGGDYQEDALFVHVVNDKDPDDFFFVTDHGLYQSLREADFNVVLQDNDQVTDDGSLSVYCGINGIPYVNVEAQHGHLSEQTHMIHFLYEVLRPADNRTEVV